MCGLITARAEGIRDSERISLTAVLLLGPSDRPVFLSAAAGSDHGYSNRALKLCRAALSSLLSEIIDGENVFAQNLH